MDFMDALKLLWRRRVIVLLGILLTALAGAAVLVQVQTVYQASAQYLLLLPAEAAGKKNPQNPLVDQPAGLIIAASLIAAEVNTTDSVSSMEDNGFNSDFSLALSPDSGALLGVQVTDTDPSAAVEHRDELLKRLDARLSQVQRREIRGIPENQVITSLVVAANAEAEAVPGAKIKALVIVVALGGVLTVLAAFVLDRPLRLRAEARAASRTSRTDRRRG
jgi:capsular polysaccharide biosynthesis protein